MLSKIENFRVRLLALRSTIHNEKQLDTIELCAMLSKKTNELIDVTNEMLDFVSNLTVKGANYEIVYDESTESLTLKEVES